MVWSNTSSVVTTISAGCNPPYHSSPDEPCGTECIGKPKGSRYYCCCTGDLCNQKFRLPDVEINPNPTTSINQTSEVEFQLSTENGSGNLWPVIPLLFIITVVIAYIYRYKKSSNCTSRNIDPGINPLDYIQDNRRIKPVSENLTDRELNELRNSRDISILAPFQPALHAGFLNNDGNNNNPNFGPNNSGQHLQQAVIPMTNHDDANQFSASNGISRNQAAHHAVNLPRIDLKSIELLEIVGKGRFGVVWKAIERGTTVEIAVKIIAPCDQQSWLNEIQIYTFYRVRHRNVLNFIYADAHVESESYWLLVEYAPKGSLYSYLKQNLINWEEFRRIALGIVHGLSHLHEADVAHRDFKSKNVLLRKDLTPCITDFGVAAILDSRSGSQIDQKKKFLQVGTPRYMAPEVLECSVTFTKASFTKIDVYALSLVLWELLSRCSTVNKPLNQSSQAHEYQSNGTSVMSAENDTELQAHLYPCPPPPGPFLSSSSEASLNDLQDASSNMVNQHVEMEKQQVHNSMGDTIANDTSDSNIEPFMLPFQDKVGTNPDIERMRQVVVVEKRRPKIKDHWREYPTAIYCRAIEDGWEYDYDARISASCYVERLENLPHNVM